MLFSCRDTVVHRILLAFLLVAGFSGLSFAQDMSTGQAGRLAAAHELMKVTKAGENFRAVVPTIIAMQKRNIIMANPKRAKQMAEIFAEVEKEMYNNMQPLFDQIALTYARHLTVPDMKAAIVFYKTPAGQNFITKQKFIMQESMKIGQRWGMKIGQQIGMRIMQKAKEKGIRL